MVHFYWPKGNDRRWPEHHSILLREAEDYLGRGWSIIPVAGKEPPKKFSWAHYRNAPMGISDLASFIQERPEVTGLAVILGQASGGLVCRDYDEPGAYETWRDGHKDLAETLPTVRTGRGYHVYCRGPAGFAKYDDGEYRGTDKQYVLTPPSRHPRGSYYEWLISPEKEIPLVENPAEAGLSPLYILPVSYPYSSPLIHPHTSECPRPNFSQEIQKLIHRHLPTKVGERHHRIFDLARDLKSTPDLTCAQARRAFDAWFLLALPVIRTKEYMVSLVNFEDAYRRVRHLKVPGAGLDDLAKYARSIPTPKSGQEYTDPAMRLLVAICYCLQQMKRPGMPFHLAAREAGSFVGVGKTKANEMLRKLDADGVIQLVLKGVYRSRMANEYLYIGKD